MRPFHALCAAFLALAAAAAGCGPDPGSCGDGRCSYAAGESHYACPEDCPPGPDGGPGPGPGGYCGDHLPPDPDGAWLPVPPMPQYCQQWCWAATITMVANYYGIPATECELASIRAGFSYPACCSYAACSYPQCDQPAPQRQMEQMLGTVLGIHGYALDAAIGEAQLVTELSNGRPVIVGYLNSFAGHVVIVTGFAPTGGGNAFHVVDPYYGIFDVSYGQLAYGYMGGGYAWRWGYTLMHLSPRTDGCNLAWDPECGCE